MRKPALSTAARVTVVAGLISILLAGGFAYWLREAVYSQRYEVSKATAFDDLISILTAEEFFADGRDAPMARYSEYLSEVVNSSGQVVETSSRLSAFSLDKPIMPKPAPGGRGSPDFSGTPDFGYPVRLGSPDPRQDPCRSRGAALKPDCELATRLAQHEVKAWRWVRASSEFPRLLGGSDARSTVAFYVLVSPIEAEDAVADVDQVLRPALPAAVLVIMIGAYFGTRAALRPVDRIRARAAEIGERSLHQRVPVPPTRDALARLAVTLNETLDRLEGSAERQREFVADAAHELRSPIASLRAILEVAHEHPDRADWPGVNAAAIDEIRRLQDVADDLLLLARLDADNTQSPPHEAVDLAELVRRQLARRVTDEGPALTLEGIESAAVVGDARQLDRLVRNLVDNAVRHAVRAVTVWLETQSGQVILHIDDDGPGVPEADRVRVFERFTRLDEARSRDAGGVGLGLAIAREIAVRHGGTLTLEKSPAGGARAMLVLTGAG